MVYVAECLECGYKVPTDDSKFGGPCAECEEENWDVYLSKFDVPPVKKNFAVQFRMSSGILRWEYFPKEFTNEIPARRHVIDTYDCQEIVQCVEIDSYKELVEKFSKR